MTRPAREDVRRVSPVGAALGRLLLALMDVYAVAMLAYLLISAVSGDRLWPVALAGNLIHWLLLPAFPLLALMLWLRRWVRAGLVGVSVAAFVWLFGGLFLPSIPAPAACAAPSEGCPPHLTVMTFNLDHDYTDLGRIIPLLRDSGADVVALQEVSDEKAADLDSQLADVYPYRVLYGGGIPGIGLLSKVPILEHDHFKLNSPWLFQLQATLDVEGRPLTVIVAHPDPPAWLQSNNGLSYYPRGTADIITLTGMATAGGPALLMGDFNLVDQSDDYRLLARAGLRDAYRDAGWGFGSTFPASGSWLPVPPLARIDYIWITPDFEALRAWVGPDVGSDHLPVLAELAWR